MLARSTGDPETPDGFVWGDVDVVPQPSSSPAEFGRAGSRRRPVARSRPPSPARPILPTTSPLFAWLAERFAPGEATLWTGPPAALEPMLERLYAASAAADGRISLIEGSNRFHPYRISEAGRGVGVDPGEVLARIRLARAFTAYQLVALVDGWARELRRARATLLVGHDLPALFDNAEELPKEERTPLLTHVAETLSEVARASRRPMLLTLPGGVGEFPGLTEAGPRLFDLVRFDLHPTRVDLSAYRDGARLALVARAPGQVGLEAFQAPEPKEVIAPWGAPPQRTARRSRSG